MLNTIKSKIIVITLALLIILGGILSFFAYVDFKNDKELATYSCNADISTFAEKINKEIASLESTAIDLALIGQIYFKANKDYKILEYSVPKVFNLNKYSVGGGVWFKPYIIEPNLKYSYAYAYPDKNGIMRLDKEYQQTYNNYISSNWYKEIFSKVSKKNLVIWSTPYFDYEGSKRLMVTAGSGIYAKDIGLIGVSSVDWEIESIIKTVKSMQPTPNSFTLFADKDNDFIIASTDKKFNENELLGASLKKLPWYSDKIQNKDQFKYHDVTYISFFKKLDNNMILIVNVPRYELFKLVYKNAFYMFLFFFLTSVSIACLLYMVLTKNINKPIKKLTDIAHEISKGNLDTQIAISKPQEFADLAATFNKMTDDIKTHVTNLNKISKEKERIESELSIAKLIQYSALPHTFYPTMEQFEIFATMESAKEVGGDFYDFFFINPNQFMFLIADVSGKGIPAALCMMTTKTLIKNLAIEGYSPKELIEKVNNRICENNAQGFFITMFAGIIDIDTGKMTYVNCGHNPPLVKRANGQYEYLNVPSNLVLGAMENIEYAFEETQFNEGDIIFLYTDGVTEAQNNEEKLYGEARLLECINKTSGALTDILASVNKDVKEYIQDMEPSDDMTMLGFKYNGNDNNSKTFECKAENENYNSYLTWLEQICDELNIPQECRFKLELISEELYTNVANYAYDDPKGNIQVKLIKLTKNENKITMQFIDSGIPYNPLEKSDPDITLSAEERPVGGLGIFMVKQYVDDIQYTYEENKNILTLTITY